MVKQATIGEQMGFVEKDATEALSSDMDDMVAGSYEFKRVPRMMSAQMRNEEKTYRLPVNSR